LNKKAARSVEKSGHVNLSAVQRNIAEEHSSQNQGCGKLKFRRVLVGKIAVAELLENCPLPCKKKFHFSVYHSPRTGRCPETDVSQSLAVDFLQHQVLPPSLQIISDPSFILTVLERMILGGKIGAVTELRARI
jgi:hypothetical protein